MEPAALLFGGREHLPHRLPEPQGAVADGQHRGGHAASLAVAQQISPRFGRFPIAVGDRDEFLAAVSAHTEHDQQAQLLLVQADLEVDAVDPQVDVVGGGQIPGGERAGLLLPLTGQAGDRGGRQPGTGAEELLQRRPEVAGRQPVQVQQRQHLAHLRGLTCPRRQDRRGKPLAVASVGVEAAVIDPRRLHRHRTGRSQHLTRLVIPIAHHQAVAVLIELISELGHIRGNLGLQCRGQHLAGAIADNLVQQRPAGLAAVGLLGIVNYRKHGRAFPTSASTPVLIEYLIP